MSFGGFGLSQTPLGRNGTLFAFTQFGARSPDTKRSKWEILEPSEYEAHGHPYERESNKSSGNIDQCPSTPASHDELVPANSMVSPVGTLVLPVNSCRVAGS
jgi:hypothetical protein